MCNSKSNKETNKGEVCAWGAWGRASFECWDYLRNKAGIHFVHELTLENEKENTRWTWGDVIE